MVALYACSGVIKVSASNGGQFVLPVVLVRMPDISSTDHPVALTFISSG